MSYVEYTVIGCLLLLNAGWVHLYLMGTYSILVIPHFRDALSPDSTDTPRFSVVIAARDEEDTIGQALQTLMQQDYPDLEIIVVDDRSTDATGEILDRMAGQDQRLKVIHNNDLPDGWLGKTNALKIGTGHATGKWLLFTDADVHFEDGLFRKIVAYAEQSQCDHLVLIPELKTCSILMESIIRAFGIVYLLKTKAYKINRDRPGCAIGAGAFNLVRKAFFEQTEGFDWFKMEVGDDLALGMLMKQNGSRSRVAFALKEMSVIWHPSLKSLFRALERIGHYSILKPGLAALVTWPFTVAPLLTWFLAPYAWSRALALAAVIAFLIYCVTWSIRFRESFLPSLLMPLGQFMLSLILINALIRARQRGSISWRDTEYSLDELRKNQKVFF